MICVDASVAVKWVLSEPDSPLAFRLNSIALSRGHQLVAPQLLRFEITNILRQQCVRHGMSPAEAAGRFTQFSAYDVRVLHWGGIHGDALELAGRYGLPAAYDAHYLALCLREGCDFWTADKRLINAIGGQLPWLHELATFNETAIPYA